MEKGPKLRYVEAFPVEIDEEKMVALRDPLGIADEVIIVSQAALFILQFCDGQHTKKEILQKSRKLLRMPLEEEMLDKLLAYMDKNYLLDNERFQSRLRNIEIDLLRANRRPAAHAGVSYPAEKTVLTEKIHGFFTDHSGAGTPGPVNGLPTPKGIIAPHIDLRIGGTTYTHAYKRIAESPPADVYVVLGTGHAGLRNMYSVLPIDFDTPLGAIKTDTGFIKTLQSNYKSNLFEDIFLHKTEHTIEFQAIFLKKIFGDRPFKIVPILCSFSYHALIYEQFTREKATIEDFSRALRKTIREYPGKVTVIASVDLAHVGPRYGDASIPNDIFLQEVKKQDYDALECVMKMDFKGWLNTIAKIDDRYRICGFSPIYTLLACIDAQRGELLRYDQGLMDDKKSVVSYCSAVLY
ncbi:MAG: AmmeMemoRadiSam system protein B [bacterium]